AITAIETGRTPAETGWLGWCQWFGELGAVVDMFSGRDSQQKDEYFHQPNPGPTYLPNDMLWDDITRAGRAQGHCLLNFQSKNLRGMARRLLKTGRKEGRQFTYCYCGEPDTILHKQGASREAMRVIKRLDRACARLAHKMRDTLLIVTADHGHADITRYMDVNDHPALLDTLRCGVDIESRAQGYRVKPGREADFLREARAAFGPDTEILSREDMLRLKIFGNLEDEKDYPRLLERMPDFLLLPPPGALICRRAGQREFKSAHAGLDPREMAVPLVICAKQPFGRAPHRMGHVQSLFPGGRTQMWCCNSWQCCPGFGWVNRRVCWQVCCRPRSWWC
ncbi:MAG: alkaline phosphatase family protein, partial [Oscillospiraceae bacterium]|nr:alkaline phosphatase family protein [Oscillospiraceae bacterium]